ncbi:MAG: Uma2 family endonuclease [Spirulina sp. SIO3F2]|nr:Uma2 family endonuclease [Spirulina sp. SIO3F2]
MTLATSTPAAVRWNIHDLAGFPENGNRYEIIDGELVVTRAPHVRHQDIAGRIYALLLNWSLQTQHGLPYFAPGVVFSPEDATIPDVVWASNDCRANGLDAAGHFTRAPELAIEVLSLTAQDQDRDRRTKLKLYTVYGVREYWIVDRQACTIEIYQQQNMRLQRVATVGIDDQLTSPLLPGFSCAVQLVFAQ